MRHLCAQNKKKSGRWETFFHTTAYVSSVLDLPVDRDEMTGNECLLKQQRLGFIKVWFYFNKMSDILTWFETVFFCVDYSQSKRNRGWEVLVKSSHCLPTVAHFTLRINTDSTVVWEDVCFQLIMVEFEVEAQVFFYVNQKEAHFCKSKSITVGQLSHQIGHP